MGTDDAVRSAEETDDGSSTAPEAKISPEHRSAVDELCTQAFGAGRFRVQRLTDVNRGRGAFSVVLRAELSHEGPLDPAARHDQPATGPGPTNRPDTVVAKLPVDGQNGIAAASGGAYTREALAYRSIVPQSPVRTPALYALEQPTDDTCLLLLEDLSQFRAADQLDGLGPDDAVAVAATLAKLHNSWRAADRLTALPVRRNTIAGFTPDALQNGVEALATTWADEVSAEQRATFSRLVTARQGLVDRFDAAPPTLCHGDPRADNLAFDDRGVSLADETGQGPVILFDWQQLAVQFGEADVAWLAATSLAAPVRRTLDKPLIEAYGGDMDRYRLGFALPGLAVLMLAQREFPTERARRFVSASLQRIASALDDLDVAGLG